MPPLDYKQFEDYVFSLVHATPYSIYEGIASIFCLGLVVFIAWKGWKTGLRYSATLLLIEYVFFIFCSTVIFRPTGETRQYDFHPFWSYDRPELLVENIMNVIVFIPIGMILGSLLRVTFGSGFRVQGSWSKYGSWFKVNGSWSKYGSWFKVKGSWTSQATKSITWLVALLIGCSISVTIEALQFWFIKGFSELDDVMHNTVGCLIGWFMVKGSRFIYG